MNEVGYNGYTVQAQSMKNISMKLRIINFTQLGKINRYTFLIKLLLITYTYIF